MYKHKIFKNSLPGMPVVRAVRRGLIITIPLLMTGSFALVLLELPLAGYQAAIHGALGGVFALLFAFIHKVTFGILALCITFSISVSYVRQQINQTSTVIGAAFAAVGSFLIFTGFFTSAFNPASFGAQGTFTAIVSAVASSVLYTKITSTGKFTLRLYTPGADIDFNNALSAIVPVFIVLCLAFAANYGISAIFGVEGFEQLFQTGLNALFDRIASPALRALLFVVVTNLLWFLGVHGTNVLDSVSQNIFFAGNTALAGFLTKPVLDVFVLMGGCGTTASLLLAILLFSRQKNNRNLAKMAGVPVLFNINEIVVYGLPIVLNGAFFVPFMLVPLLCIAISWVAFSLGLVPPPVNSVNWVTPIFVNGYLATGSLAGSALQLVNILVGTAVYRFFLVRYEKRNTALALQDIASLSHMLKQAEANGTPLVLMELRGKEGSVAKMLAQDLKHALQNPVSISLYYQPQYNTRGCCVGGEALLRWNHPRYGMIYPPLVIQVAAESGVLQKLEQLVFKLACKDICSMRGTGKMPFKIGVNATAASLQSEVFEKYLARLLQAHPGARGVLCIELTEQMSFIMGEKERRRLSRIRDMGIELVVDDFSMGHTSVKYLQSNLFGQVKLDGALVQDVLENKRSAEIISSIVQLSHSMQFEVLAEYVETDQQQKKLEELGCDLYQGHLYCPAQPLPQFVEKHFTSTSR